MPRKTYWIAPFLVVALIGLGAGCGKTAAEKATEKAIEKSTGGKAKVDIGTNSFKVNTNSGSWQAGDKVAVPDGFPKDVYVIDGTVKSAFSTPANKSFSLSIETSKSVADAQAAYEQKLKADGWSITASGTVMNSASLVAEKGNRTTTVGVSPSDKLTIVILTTEEKAVTPVAPAAPSAY